VDDIQIQDVCRATDSPGSRISEALAGLGAAPGNRGRRASTIDLSDAIRAGVVRGLVALGLSVSEALDIARQLSRERLKAIVARDDAVWLGVCNDPDRPDGFVFTVCSSDEMKEIAAGSGGGGGLRFLDLHGIAKAIIGAALKRKQLTSANAKGATVTKFTADPRVNGAVVESIDDTTIGLAIVKHGRGQRLRLSASEARALAEKLLSMAAEHDASTPEKLN
jgi:hypothetical protein